MQWLKKLLTQRSPSNGVFIGGEKWNPRPLGARLRGKDAVHLIEQMTPDHRLASIVDPRGEPDDAKAVLAKCREQSSRLRDAK